MLRLPGGRTRDAARPGGAGRQPYPYRAAGRHGHRAHLSRETGASAPSDTTRRHTAHNSELRRVEYPWHPLFGQELLIEREIGPAGRRVFCCRVPGQQERRYGFQIPRWMFDRATCALMRPEPRGRVDWAILTAARTLLQEACSISLAPDIDHRRIALWEGGNTGVG